MTRSSAAAAFLKRRDTRGHLTFILCGSVDDGKSTLLGRLLFDTSSAPEDLLRETGVMTQKGHKITNPSLLANLVDGLRAEREQGITIDYAHSYFETKDRSFVAIDAPGHPQYTHNFVSAASHADAAILLVDASRGIQGQTRRHHQVLSLMGIRDILVAINKMDLVGYDQDCYDEIVNLIGSTDQNPISTIPISALDGTNITKRGEPSWYSGPTLLEWLETRAQRDDSQVAFRLPIQGVSRQENSYVRGLRGMIVSGRIEVGMEVAVGRHRSRTQISRIYGPSGELPSAFAGQSVTVTLSNDIDVGRGDMIADPIDEPEIADQLAAHVVWLDSKTELVTERQYHLQLSSASTLARMTALKYRIDSDSSARLTAETLHQNEIGHCHFVLDHPVPFDAFKKCRWTGCFLLIDRISNVTAAAGIIDFPLYRSQNIKWQKLKLDKVTRSRAMGQKPLVVWLTGLSGAGKTTIANELEQRCHMQGYRTYLLDGDNIRHGLNRDLGFTSDERAENIRRVAETAKLMVDAGLIVIVAAISPFHIERQMARGIFEEEEFIEVFVDAPLHVCEARDAKGLYAKARRGELPNFTGIDSPYERPESPDLRLETAYLPAEEAAEKILTMLQSRVSL